MEIKEIADIILLKTKREVIKVHLYSKMLQHGIKPVDKDLNLIADLYLMGGYSNTLEQKKFLQYCVQVKYRMSEHSVRNVLSKYTLSGILEKKKNTTLCVSDKYLPKITFDKIVLNSKISHAE